MEKKKFLLGLAGGMLGGIVVLTAALITDSLGSFQSNEKHPLVQQYDYSHKNVPVQKTGLFSQSEFSAPDFTDAAEKAVNAVVHVKTQYNAPNYTLYDYFFGTAPRYSTPVMASGSGVILSSDGYIITNNHVIENAEVIQVVLNDKRLFDAKLIGKDGASDLALLKVEANDLPFIPYANSENVKVDK
ncbi:MAG TPA: trypsin-like peptidase domain-containing protein [Bacteroidales bacterium]|nr:trypsin-like peptidase domain-containing protein [Bacteroidales bacterium]